MTELKKSFDTTDYEIVERKVVYQGFFRLVRYQLRHRLFAGGWSNTVVREVLERRPAAAVLLYDPLLDRIVVIEQFRAGIVNQSVSPWLFEIVAGVCPEGETPEELVIREAKEEANCDIIALHMIHQFWVSPGGTSEYLYLYCGRIDASQVGGLHGLLDEDEDIRVTTMPVQEALAHLQQGHIDNAYTLIALQWLQLHHQFIREKWSA